MMKVSAAGGLSESRANSQRNGHSGRGFAPPSVGSGGPVGPFGPEDGGDRDHDDHRQGREERVLEHRLAQEGDAALQLLLVLLVVGRRDRPAGRGPAAR